MKSSKNALHFVFSALVLAMVLTVGFLAVHSSLFALKTIKVAPLSEGYPLSIEEVESLLQLPKGQVNLFELDLKPVEGRLVKHPWVKGVVLSKQFPNHLSVQILERKPIALVNTGGGSGSTATVDKTSARIFYLESDGTLFDEKSIRFARELPILSGVRPDDSQGLQQMSEFVRDWFDPEAIPGLKLSSLSLDSKLGLRAVISYPMEQNKSSNNRSMRLILEMGLNIPEVKTVSSEGLRSVLQYLAQRSKAASRIWLGDGKKIVVKMSRGS